MEPTENRYLGCNADTTAAITGQLAGAFYSVSGIPGRWLELLHMRGEISDLAKQLLHHRVTQ